MVVGEDVASVVEDEARAGALAAAPATCRVTTPGSTLSAMPATLPGARPVFSGACGSSTVLKPPFRSAYAPTAPPSHPPPGTAATPRPPAAAPVRGAAGRWPPAVHRSYCSRGRRARGAACRPPGAPRCRAAAYRRPGWAGWAGPPPCPMPCARRRTRRRDRPARRARRRAAGSGRPRGAPGRAVRRGPAWPREAGGAGAVRRGAGRPRAGVPCAGVPPCGGRAPPAPSCPAAEWHPGAVRAVPGPTGRGRRRAACGRGPGRAAAAPGRGPPGRGASPPADEAAGGAGPSASPPAPAGAGRGLPVEPRGVAGPPSARPPPSEGTGDVRAGTPSVSCGAVPLPGPAPSAVRGGPESGPEPDGSTTSASPAVFPSSMLSPHLLALARQRSTSPAPSPVLPRARPTLDSTRSRRRAEAGQVWGRRRA